MTYHYRMKERKLDPPRHGLVKRLPRFVAEGDG